jgi:hypothetical protein
MSRADISAASYCGKMRDLRDLVELSNVDTFVSSVPRT